MTNITKNGALVNDKEPNTDTIVEDIINSPAFYATIIVAGVLGFVATYYSKKRISRRQLRKARQFTSPISKMLNDLYADEEDLGHC